MKYFIINFSTYKNVIFEGVNLMVLYILEIYKKIISCQFYQDSEMTKNDSNMNIQDYVILFQKYCLAH